MAMEKALATPELLEQILLHCDDRQIFTELTRVSKQWQAAIQASPILRRRLFLEAEPQPDRSDKNTDIIPLRTNPFFQARINAWIRFAYWKRQIEGSWNPIWVEMIDEHSYPQKASWRTQLTQQPPIKTVTVAIECLREIPEIDGQIRCTGYAIANFDFNASGGLRMGALLEIMKTARLRGTASFELNGRGDLFWPRYTGHEPGCPVEEPTHQNWSPTRAARRGCQKCAIPYFDTDKDNHSHFVLLMRHGIRRGRGKTINLEEEITTDRNLLAKAKSRSKELVEYLGNRCYSGVESPNRYLKDVHWKARQDDEWQDVIEVLGDKTAAMIFLQDVGCAENKDANPYTL
ncbi:putative F-box domain-containing protein [Seiridium cardinale]